jgi:hypothetical protein
VVIYFWVIPTLDHIKDRLDADTAEKLALVDEIKRSHQRLRGLLDYKENQTEARDLMGEFSEGQTIETSVISFILSPFL